MRKLSIAIDGPAGAGKSSVSKILAGRLHYAYLDTGAMYRAVTYEVLTRKVEGEESIISMTEKLDMEVQPGEAGMEVFVDGKNVTPFIRTPEVSSKVSAVSAIGGVRKAMVVIQRKQAEKGGIVLDGRDIGTTVLPKADVKIFLTASVHTRALRRFKEITEVHPEMTMEEVEKEISRRDYLDSHREISPLRKAEDAILLDNGDLTLEGTAEAIISICEKKFPGFDR
ncbi:(d)CMP kinase [Dialister sp.]|uniref:(d)CMP kinase n=1 Tax=Dialister sp. TaxID=1955814 RepID=UPI002E81DEE5|nr:(d)CMP kinase [Dialister sp.]MEE3452665.1 (d)CMP kinase [Dialister sp.]